MLLLQFHIVVFVIGARQRLLVSRLEPDGSPTKPCAFHASGSLFAKEAWIGLHTIQRHRKFLFLVRIEHIARFLESRNVELDNGNLLVWNDGRKVVVTA